MILLMVGKLKFLNITIMDITYSVQHLRKYMQDPTEPHLKVAIHVLRYLKNDPILGISCLLILHLFLKHTLGIFMSRDPTFILKAYCD